MIMIEKLKVDIFKWNKLEIKKKNYVFLNMK